jgi:hypothetical protein
MEKVLRCNICDELVDMLEAGQHVSGRNHAIRKKVVEFHEMNAQVGGKRNYDGDTSVINAWIKGLYSYDFLSSGQT